MDGDLATKFWNKVEGIGNVFVFVRSEHGKTFGGYRGALFNKPMNNRLGEALFYKDTRAYIF